jgi:hypothetical protein
MQLIQIYPRVESDDYTQGYKDGYAAADSKSFTRGVLTVFWFFYRLLNGGKQKGPSDGLTQTYPNN